MADARRFHGGLSAEAQARAAYERMGARCLAERYRTADGEIDLVMRHGDVIIFAEVKLRTGRTGADSPVSPRQWRRVAAAALGWMAEHPDTTVTGYRFDAVIVSADKAPMIVEDAFRPPETPW